MDTIGVYSYGYFYGLEIKYIDDIEDKIYFVESFNSSEPTVKDVHKCKIYFDTKNPYFKINNRRVRLNECLRVNF